MDFSFLKYMLIVAGIGQLITGLLNAFIHQKIFNWYNDINQLTALNRKIVLVHHAYIIGLTLAFGVIGLVYLDELLIPGQWSIVIAGLIAVFWTGKIFLQFFYYPKIEFPRTWYNRIGALVMNALTIIMAVTYATVTFLNISGL